MKNLWIGVILLAAMPGLALAGRSGGYHGGGHDYHRGYDRGSRYHGDWGHHSSHDNFGFTFGFGSSAWAGDNWYLGFGYNNYRRPVYAAPVYVEPPVVVAPPPVIVSPAPPVYYTPAPRYYYGGCSPGYYSGRARYYYGR